MGRLDVGVEEVGDDVGERRWVVEDLLGRLDVAGRLVVEGVPVDGVGDHGLAAGAAEEGEDLCLTPLLGRPEHELDGRRARQLAAEHVDGADVHAGLAALLGQGSQLSGAIWQVRAHPPQHVPSMPHRGASFSHSSEMRVSLLRGRD